MQTILLVLYPIINAILNRWPRGTYSWGPWVAAAVLSVMIFLVTSNYIAAGVFFATYVAGESFGWGKWLATIPYWNDKSFTQEMYNTGEVKASGIPLLERDDGKNNGVHLLANLCAKETKNFRSYAWYALMFRGALWYTPILIGLAFTGAINPFIVPFALTIIAVLFPIIYGLTHRLFGNAYWKMGELMYGFVQGLVIAGSLAVSL